MLYSNKSIGDYNRMVLQTQFKFHENGVKYTTHQEDLSQTFYTMIATGIQATILIYNFAEECVIMETFYKADADLFNKLSKEVSNQ